MIAFPPVDRATEEGLLCAGGDLQPRTLISAYAQGIFPWPQEGWPLLWFAPPERGILFFEELRVSRRLQQYLKKAGFTCTFNKAFAEVIENCKNVQRPGQKGTWITDAIVAAYSELHRAHHAFSVEVWRDKRLVGGLYGVFIKGVISGESMFSLVDHASKAALVFAAETLRRGGVSWMDTQMVTPVIELLGGRLIARDHYMGLLSGAQQNNSGLLYEDLFSTKEGNGVVTDR